MRTRAARTTATWPRVTLTALGLSIVLLAACSPSPTTSAEGATPSSGPVHYSAPVAEGRTFVNQSTSFVSLPGTVASRRPQATEPVTTSLFEPRTQGLPPGVEWRVLWLRAKNCESGTRRIEFFVQQEGVTSMTVRRFVQGDTWSIGQPNRAVGTEVAPGGELGWLESASDPLILGPGQSVGARFHDMAGGASGCNWQYGAIQQPEGTGVADAPASLPRHEVNGSFTSDRPGLRVSWRTVPTGRYWIPETVTARNCERSPRQMDVVLLGPGNITHGVVTTAENGSGPATVAPGGSFTWSSTPAAARLVLPAGWSLGVRWHGMDGADRSECTWTATFSTATEGVTGDVFDASIR
jgi:hypothetical protein